MAEYQKFVKYSSELRVAFQDHLVGLCDLLLGVHLITSDSVSEVTNRANPAPGRASTLLGIIRNKVKLDKNNYYEFVKAIQKDREGQYRPEYRHILKILGEKYPEPQCEPPATSAAIRSTSPVFQHFVETDVIQQHCADITAAIKENLPEFGMHMAEKGCCTQAKVDDITGLLGVGNFQKAGKLLEIITSRIKTSGSRKKARDIFDCLVFVLQFKLENEDIADTIVATMTKKDPFYQRPPSHSGEDKCEQKGVQDSEPPKEKSMLVSGSPPTFDVKKPSDSYPTQAEDVNASSKMSGLSPPPIVPPQGRSVAAVKQQEAESKDHTDVQDEQQDEQKRPPSKNSSNASLTQRSQNSEDQNDVHPMQATAQPENGDDARVEPDSGPPTEKGTATPSIQPESECSLEYLDLEDKSCDVKNVNRGKPKIAFRDSMSEEDFLEYLKLKGLSGKDRKTIEDNGITPIVFAHHFEEGLAELEFTVGGKIILEKLHKIMGP